MLRQAQERKIKGQQAAAVDTRAAETRVRAAEAKAKAKVAREEAEERAARVRDGTHMHGRWMDGPCLVMPSARCLVWCVPLTGASVVLLSVTAAACVSCTDSCPG